MKKIRLLSIILIILLFSSSFVFAADEVLDIEKAAIKAVQNSSSVKVTNNYLDMASDSYTTIMNTTERSKRLLLIPQGTNTFTIIKNLELLPITAENQLNKADINFQTTQSFTRIAAYRAYITLLGADYGVELQEKLVKNMETNYKNAQTKLKLGTMSSSDAKIAEINYLKEKLNLQKYQRNAQSALMALNKMMGEPLTKEYSQYVENNINPSDTMRSLEDYLNSSVSSRSEVLTAQWDLDFKKKEQVHDKLTHPILTDIYYTTSKYDLQEAENILTTAKIDVEMDLTTGYRNLETKMKDWENAENQYDLAKTTYDNVSKSYAQGLVSVIQLMEADKSLTGSKIQLRNAQLEAWLYQIRMDIASSIGPGMKAQDENLQLMGGLK